MVALGNLDRDTKEFQQSPIVLASCAVLVLLSIAIQGSAAAQEADVWSGVYTEAQAQRGKQVHAAVCSQCHGLKLDGAGQPDMPAASAIARRQFVRKWNGKSIATLFAYTRATMPPMNPGSLSDQQYIDAIAYILKMSDIPSGSNELLPKSPQLDAIIIRLE